MKKIVPSIAITLLWRAWLGAPGFAAESGKVTSTQIAKGVYLFQTTAYGDVGFGGNSIVILTDEGVVVFDTSGTPASGKAILDGIQQLTNKPVLYVINSHWHWDHWGGNQVFPAAYPNVQFLSHEKNLDQMMHVAIAWNAPGLELDLPQYIGQLKEKLKAMEARHARERDLVQLRTLLAADEDFLKEKRSVTYTFPNVTFSDQVTLRLGGREIQVLHARAVTPGKNC
jgi:cyclase